MWHGTRGRLGLAALALVCGLLVASAGFAQDDDWGDWGAEEDTGPVSPYGRKGIYVGFGGIYAMEDFNRPAIPIQGVDISGDDTGGIDVRFGYRFQPHFAGEVLFQYTADFQLKGQSTTQSTSDRFGGYSFTLNGKAYPWLGRFQPFALLGMGGLHFVDKRGDDTGFLLRLGGGIDFYVSDEVVLYFEGAYAMPAGEIDKLPFATFGAGATYRY